MKLSTSLWLITITGINVIVGLLDVKYPIALSLVLVVTVFCALQYVVETLRENQ